MVVIQCKCGVKFETHLPDDGNFLYLSCQSCGKRVPPEISEQLNIFYRLTKDSEYKVFFDAGNMFNAQLTLRTSNEH